MARDADRPPNRAVDPVLDRLGDELFAVDGDRRVTHWNDRVAETTGVEERTAIGSRVDELGIGLDGSELGDALATVLAGDAERVDVETVPPVFSGEVARVHGDPEGAVLQVLSHDTRTSEDAKLLEDLLDELLVETGDTVYFKDEESRFVRVSRSKAEEVGLTREEIRGKSDFDFMPEEMARERYEDERRIMETGESIVNPEERLLTAEGGTRWLKSEKLPWHDDDGEVIGTFGISRDVTELKELEDTLAELEELVDRVSVWLLALDAEGVVTWANQAAAETLAGPDSELLDRSITDLAANGPLDEGFLVEYDDCVDRLMAGTSRDDTDVISEVPVIAPGGDRRICNVHVRLRPLVAGQFRGTVVAFHDVTTQVEQERALKRQYERLERLVETISHDLRNPLMVATGEVGLAAEESDGEGLADTAAALERMERLVDQLLMMAREGRAVEDPEPVSIEDVARRAWRPFQDSGVTLAVEDDGTVLADGDRLVRLFENLFRNAVEHAGDDVTVRVGATDDGFFVDDDGDGIPPSARDDVFDHGFTTREEGTGLGLSTVAEIVAAHDWSISVDEGPEGGTRFDVTTEG